MNYFGVKCTVCKKKFTEGDDIVVCHKCGTPHHRSCYNILGQCVNEEKHGTEEALWHDPRKKDLEVDDELHENFIICGRCLHKNPKGVSACKICGASLCKNWEDKNEGNKNQTSFVEDIQAKAIKVLFDPLGGVDPQEDFDGVKAEDLSNFIGNSKQHYMTTFKGIKDSGRDRFSFVAFVFSGLWMLYRKQYKIGIFITIIMPAITLLSTFILSLSPVDLFGQAILQSGLENKSVFTISEYASIIKSLFSIPLEKQLPYWIPRILNLIFFIFKFIVGIKANRWYMKHCISMIKKIKTNHKDSKNYLNDIQSAGGVDYGVFWYVLCCVVAIDIIVLAFM